MTPKHRNPRLIPRNWNDATMQWEYVCPDCKFMVASITAETVTKNWGMFPKGKPQPWTTHNCPTPTDTTPTTHTNTKEKDKK